MHNARFISSDLSTMRRLDPSIKQADPRRWGSHSGRCGVVLQGDEAMTEHVLARCLVYGISVLFFPASLCLPCERGIKFHHQCQRDSPQ